MVISVCIFGGLTVGLWHLWGKRTSARGEGDEDGEKFNMRQHTEGVTDKDLSLGTFAHSYFVRYGCRPDFKGMSSFICFYYDKL